MGRCFNWNINYITFQWFTTGPFSKYIENVKIGFYSLGLFKFGREHVIKPSSSYGRLFIFDAGNSRFHPSLLNDRLDINEIFMKGP